MFQKLSETVNTYSTIIQTDFMMELQQFHLKLTFIWTLNFNFANWNQTGKVSSIRRTAFWEAGVPRCHIPWLRAPWWPPPSSKHHSTIVSRDLRGALNWDCIIQRGECSLHFFFILVKEYTEKTIFLFPFKLNGIWSWWQFSFRFWTKWNSIWVKIERKTVTTIISHSMWKEIEI